jgi:hypothetical protein
MVLETLLYVISLLFAVMLLVILGQKLRIAYPVFLVIGGLLISLIPGAPHLAALLRTNTLVKNLKQRLTDDIDYTRLNIESLKDNKDEKQQVSEFNDVLMDLGEFLNKQLSSLRLQKLFDEDVIRLEEGRIVLEQNKIG